MKKATTVALVAALAVCSFFLAKSCRDAGQYDKLKAQYEEYKKVAEADNYLAHQRIAELEEIQNNLQGEIDSSNTVIAQYESSIEQLKHNVGAANAATEKLRTEVQPVLDQNPKVAELVASLDATIVLQGSLVEEQDGMIKMLKSRITLGDERFNNQVQISEEWKSMYEREHTLRVQAEDLFKSCEHAKKTNKMWGNVKAVAVGVAVGVVVNAVSK